MPSKGTKGLNNTEYVLQDCFNYYNRETDPQYFESKFTDKKNNFKLDERAYKALCKEALLLIRQSILNGDIVNLGSRMGHIQIVKKKANIKVYTNKVNSIVDWVTSKKLGKKILNFNDHTNDYIYRIKWLKNTCNAKNRGIYSFIPNRFFKRELAFYIKTLKKDYPEPVTYFR
jgi:hypothetical protein